MTDEIRQLISSVLGVELDHPALAPVVLVMVGLGIMLSCYALAACLWIRPRNVATRKRREHETNVLSRLRSKN
ncbi:MAG: hypothetical protein ABL907_09735 [Hyphomicrobium sp.]